MSWDAPPGWKSMYGVILYTLPWKTDQASSFFLCSATSDSVIRWGVANPACTLDQRVLQLSWARLTLSSSPPSLHSLAQSKGE